MIRTKDLSSSSQYRNGIFEQMKALAPTIKAAVGQNCEVVIHDFSDLEHSIIWIEGNVTSRKIGGSLTDLGLAKIRAGETEDLHNYTTHTDDGQTLRSSSTFLRDDNGEVFGALCINIDITPLLAFQHVLDDLCGRDGSQEFTETFSDDIHEILETMIEDATCEIGKPPSLMSKEERVIFVSILDGKGTFQVKKAVPFVANRLGVSRYTVYNYLNEARERQDSDPVGMETA